jgi:2'-5' RNA ligase
MNSPAEWRLFVAVPLPEAVKAQLRELALPYLEENLRWVPDQNLHLTLLFLGPTPTSDLPLLTGKLATLAAAFSPFQLDLQELSPGPKLSAPRLIWARFKDSAPFNQLSTAVAQDLQPGNQVPHSFIPHVTVARYPKSNAPRDLRAVPVSEKLIFEVDRLELWRSELASPHPVYSSLQSFPFSKAVGE